MERSRTDLLMNAISRSLRCHGQRRFKDKTQLSQTRSYIINSLSFPPKFIVLICLKKGRAKRLATALPNSEIRSDLPRRQKQRIWSDLVRGRLNEVRHGSLTSKPFHAAQHLSRKVMTWVEWLRKKCLVYSTGRGWQKSLTNSFLKSCQTFPQSVEIYGKSKIVHNQFFSWRTWNIW